MARSTSTQNNSSPGKVVAGAYAECTCTHCNQPPCLVGVYREEHCERSTKTLRCPRWPAVNHSRICRETSLGKRIFSSDRVWLMLDVPFQTSVDSRPGHVPWLLTKYSFVSWDLDAAHVCPCVFFRIWKQHQNVYLTWEGMLVAAVITIFTSKCFKRGSTPAQSDRELALPSPETVCERVDLVIQSCGLHEFTWHPELQEYYTVEACSKRLFNL